MLSWVRRARLLVLVAAVALVAAGCVTFTGNKEVTGGESDGPFVVRISCPGADPESEDLTFIGESTETSDDFEIGPGATTCTIVEIEQAGATSVTYLCGEITIDPLVDLTESGAEGGPGMSASRGGSNTAECTEGADGLTVEIFLVSEAEVAVSFTVINDFTPTPTTTTAPPDPASVEAVAPTPVPAQVIAFTG
jgi:hypothetical protein